MTKEELLKVIDGELELHNSNHSRRGLTRWAIWVGLSSLIWILIGLLEKPDGSLFFSRLLSRSVVQIFLVLMIAIEFLRLLFRMLWPGEGSESGWINTSLFRNYAMRTCMEALVIWGCFIFVGFTSRWLGYFICVYLWLLIVGAPLTRVYPFIPSIKKLEKDVAGISLGIALHFAFWLIMLIDVLHGLLSSTPVDGFVSLDLRVALVLFALIKLLFELVDSGSSNPIVDNLVDCRKQLLLNSMGEADAERVLRIYLGSAKLADYLRDQIGAILRRQESSVSFIQEIKRELTLYGPMSDEKFKRETGKLPADYLMELNSRIEKFRETVTSSDRDMGKLRMKFSLFLKFNPDLELDVNETLFPMFEMRKQLAVEQGKFSEFVEEQKGNRALPKSSEA